MGPDARAAEHVRAPALAAQAQLERLLLLPREPQHRALRSFLDDDPVGQLHEQLEPLDRIALDVEAQRHLVALERALAAEPGLDPKLRGALEGERERERERERAGERDQLGPASASAASSAAPTSPA